MSDFIGSMQIQLTDGTHLNLREYKDGTDVTVTKVDDTTVSFTLPRQAVQELGLWLTGKDE